MSARLSSAVVVALISGLIGFAFASREQMTPSAGPDAIASGPVQEAYWFDSDTKISGYARSEKGYFAPSGVSVTHFTGVEAHATVYPD